MNLTASCTAPPPLTVLNGRTENGRTDPDLLTEEVEGPPKAAACEAQLGGDIHPLATQTCFVEPTEDGGRAKWNGFGPDRFRSHTLTRTAGEVLPDTDPPVLLTLRAQAKLAEAREAYLDLILSGGNSDHSPGRRRRPVESLPQRLAEAALAARLPDIEGREHCSQSLSASCCALIADNSTHVRRKRGRPRSHAAARGQGLPPTVRPQCEWP